MTSSHLSLDGKSLTIEDIAQVAYDHSITVTISEDVQSQIKESRQVIDKVVAEEQVVYGVNTGFGSFKDQVISHDDVERLQLNLIRSHAIGVGPMFSEPEVRAAMLIRANSLVRGFSGIRLETIEALLNLLNHHIYPFVPQQGSVGSSGDLAPLSHLMLVLIGEGEVIEDGKRTETAPILKKKNITPVTLSYKEGLALNNGTAFMTAVAALNIYNARRIIDWSDKALAMSLEALRGTLDAYSEAVLNVRPHPGQLATGAAVRSLCEGSQLLGPNNDYQDVQDSYCLRCAPQVHGSVKDVFSHVASVIEVEINSTTDNPLVFPQGMVKSGGNFDGQPISLAMDNLAIAMSELGTVTERRIAKFMDRHNNNDLPAFLIPPEQAGLSSGFMIAQYTAAALVAENRVLSHPVSNDSIPTSANQEDHVSFGTIAARKCRDIINNTEKILAIELMSAAQALDFRKPLTPGKGVAQIHATIREKVPFLKEDVILYKELEKILSIMF